MADIVLGDIRHGEGQGPGAEWGQGSWAKGGGSAKGCGMREALTLDPSPRGRGEDVVGGECGGGDVLRARSVWSCGWNCVSALEGILGLVSSSRAIGFQVFRRNFVGCNELVVLLRGYPYPISVFLELE